MTKSDLFDDFSEVSAKQWKQKIQYDLKGADYNDTLVWESVEGIKVKPFYHADDTEHLNIPKQESREWHIAQTIYAGDLEKADVKAKDVLKKGVESLIFIIPSEKINLVKLLEGIAEKDVSIHFNFQFLAFEPIEELYALLKDKPVKVYFHLDSIGNLVRTGNWFHSKEEDSVLLSKIITSSLERKNSFPIGIDVSLYQNAGANIVQQLAYGLAHAHEYLNEFQTKLPIPSFKVAVGGNYFFEIAKIKALRWLWSSLAQEYGISEECHIMAIPSKRNKTLYDYNVNMLRTTSECMSGILGGADTVCNLPYDSVYHKDNEFAERIARNQLILLKEESYFNEVSGAAEGAYYIESLTHQLAEKALALFKQIEVSGGFLDALKKGTIQQKIADNAAKEQTLFDDGQTVLLGTNTYQNPNDRMKDDLELYPFLKKRSEKTLIAPIIEKRWAEALEQKRLDDE